VYVYILFVSVSQYVKHDHSVVGVLIKYRAIHRLETEALLCDVEKRAYRYMISDCVTVLRVFTASEASEARVPPSNTFIMIALRDEVTGVRFLHRISFMATHQVFRVDGGAPTGLSDGGEPR